MFWWHHAAELLRDGKTQAFGFITTNSIHQTFNRRCLEPFLNNDKKPVSITFAIPDHPWVDSSDGADVRIAMTAASAGNLEGTLQHVISEKPIENGEIAVTLQTERGKIFANLKIGADTGSAVPLEANAGMSSRGMTLGGKGFFLTASELPESHENDSLIRPFLGSRDVTQLSRRLHVIDALGLTEKELEDKSPWCYQHLLNYVKPERIQNSRESYRRKWWVFAEPRSTFRAALNGCPTYIITPRTAKHRTFLFLDGTICPESELVGIASQDSWMLGALSSNIHMVWSLVQGGRMGIGNDPRYNNSRCFETFPFPDLPDGELKDQLRNLGEKLDAHRKTRQIEHPELTLTGMYNVLEKLRSGEPLTAKDKTIHNDGLVTLLMQIHDDIDRAVYQAYGWQDIWQWQQDAWRGSCFDPETDIATQLEVEAGGLADAITPYLEKYEQVLLQRLVDLNHERAAEEAQGKIRYLRPDFQNPEGTQTTQTEASLTPTAKKTATKQAPKAKASIKVKWPKTMPEQVTSIHSLISTIGPDPEALDLTFGRANKKRRAQIEQILATLEALGQI